VVVCGVKGRDYFREEGFAPGRIFIVPLVPAWDAPPLIAPFAERPFHLLWAAQMNDEVKNVSFFTALASKLKERVPDFKVKLVGAGSAKDRVLSDLTQAGISFAYDSVPWDKMHEAYNSSRALILPSLAEPWGLVCNEAMQCGVPCVVSPFVGAGDDLVVSGKNGLVLPLDVDVWTERLQRMVTVEQLWTQFSTAARAAMKTRTIDSSVAAFADVATSMLDAPVYGRL
jgi:glycosyltransferase involved in cell wall biosynthesis